MESTKEPDSDPFLDTLIKEAITHYFEEPYLYANSVPWIEKKAFNPTGE